MANVKRNVGDRWTDPKTKIMVRQGVKTKTYGYKITVSGKTEWKYFKTLAAAVSAKAKAKVAKDSGTYILTDQTKLKEYLEDWLENLQGVKPITKNRYRIHIEHITDAIGDITLQKLTTYTIEKFINNVKTSKNSKIKSGPKLLSPRTRVFILSTLKKALDKAVRDQIISRNPAALVPSPKDAHVYKGKRPLADGEIYTKQHILSPANVIELLDHLKPYPNTHLPIYVLYSASLRRGELMGVRWSDVLFDENKLWIHSTVNEYCEVTTPKTELSQGYVDVPTDLMAKLKKHKREQAAYSSANYGLWQSSEWFVFGKDENPALPTRPGTIGQRLNHHLRNTRMAKATCHDLRHASASALLASGWSIADVAARLRETIETCSKTYVHSLATSHDNDALKNALGL